MMLPISPTIESDSMNTSTNLPAWLADCVPVFRAASNRHSLPGSSRYTVIGAMVLMVVGAGALMFTRLKFWQAACFGVGLPLAAFLSAVLLHYVNGAALQNTPANAALVPRMNRLIRRTAALLWGGAMLGWSMVGAVVPHGALVVLVAALALAVLSLARGGRAEAVVGLIVGDIAIVTGGKPLRDFVEQPAVLLLAFVSAILLSWRALGMAFPRAADAKIDTPAKRKALLTLSGSLDRDVVRVQAASVSRPLYARVLARDIARRRPGPLLMHALGPTGHRFYVALPVAVGAALLALLRLGATTLWPAGWDDARIAFPVIMMSTMGALLAMFAVIVRYGIGIANFAEEQALVRMAPRVPRPSLLNRPLAVQMVRSLLVDWVIVTGLLLALLGYWQVSGAAIGRVAVLMCCMLIPLGWPLRNHAAAASFDWWHGLGIAALTIALAAVALLAGDKAAVVLVPALIAAGLIGAARWRTMMAAPPAFPARRLD